MNDSPEETTEARPRRHWWPTRSNLTLWGIVIAAYLVSYVSTATSRSLFVGDSHYYAAMALRFSGESRAEAARIVAEKSTELGWRVIPAETLFGWDLVRPRVVYPALSAPFVKFMGISGLAVVSAIALFALYVVLTMQLRARYGNLAALVPILLIAASNYLSIYGAVMITESLTALWVALIVAAVWRYLNEPSGRMLWAMGLLTVVLGFTRQATLIPAGAVIMAWLCALLLRQDHARWRWPALVVGGTGIGVQVLQMLLFPGFSQVDQFKKVTHTDTLWEAVLTAPRLAAHIAKADVKVMAAADHALMMLLIFAVVSMVIFWRRPESHLLLGSLLAYALYNITNGTPTAFRYGMPGLVFVACSVSLLVASARGALRPAPPALAD